MSDEIIEPGPYIPRSSIDPDIILLVRRKPPGILFREKDKKKIVEACLEAMSDGESLFDVAEYIGMSMTTILGWIGKREEWNRAYESSKSTRARAFMERALGEILRPHTWESAKIADVRARTLMRVAAVLSPREFSDKMHHNLVKHASSSSPMSITLNFGGQQASENKGELVAIPQPEDGKLP